MGEYGDVSKEQEAIWQQISNFIKVDRLEDEGLASTLETTEGIDLSKVQVAVEMVDGVPKIKVIVEGGTNEGKKYLQKKIIGFIVDKYPRAEIAFN